MSRRPGPSCRADPADRADRAKDTKPEVGGMRIGQVDKPPTKTPCWLWGVSLTSDMVVSLNYSEQLVPTNARSRSYVDWEPYVYIYMIWLVNNSCLVGNYCQFSDILVKSAIMPERYILMEKETCLLDPSGKYTVPLMEHWDWSHLLHVFCVKPHLQLFEGFLK